MIWLAWRQFRVAAFAMALLAVAVLGTLVLTGPHIAHLYSVSGLNHCVSPDACSQARDAFFGAIKSDGSTPVVYFALIAVLYLLPALLGLFWGAPLLARESEAGTFRLVWTQSVTRRRWLAVKLSVGTAAAIVLTTALSWGITWWSSPIDRAAQLPGGQDDALPNHFNPVVFGARGVVPVAIAVFGFLVGVTAGLLLRRTLPAVAATLAILATVQATVPMAVRQNYATPDRTTVPLVVQSRPGLQLQIVDSRLTVRMPVDLPGAWVTSVNLVDATGTPFHGLAPQACEGMLESPDSCFAAINALHLRQAAEYQPGDRFGRFQGEEAALYALLSIVLAGLCFYRIRRMVPA
ncbi:transporter [Catenulispora yoronensis]|uniref:Transporter n=1 Tax=Catenulispora yoronensis TaxID=450799 RepID=A0ABN2UPX3_9ACTN